MSTTPPDDACEWMRAHLDPLLKDIVAEAVKSRPTDLKEFIIARLGSRDTASAAPAHTKSTASTVTVETKEDDGIETDTTALETVEDLRTLLLDGADGRLPSDEGARYSISYSQAALSGWVKQFSPSCAAASTAGAWNAVCGITRDHPYALDTSDVLAVFEGMTDDRIAAKRASIERCLGGVDISPLEPHVAAHLERTLGKGIGGENKATAASVKEVMRSLRAVIAERLGEDPEQAAQRAWAASLTAKQRKKELKDAAGAVGVAAAAAAAAMATANVVADAAADGSVGGGACAGSSDAAPGVDAPLAVSPDAAAAAAAADAAAMAYAAAATAVVPAVDLNFGAWVVEGEAAEEAEAVFRALGEIIFLEELDHLATEQREADMEAAMEAAMQRDHDLAMQRQQAGGDGEGDGNKENGKEEEDASGVGVPGGQLLMVVDMSNDGPKKRRGGGKKGRGGKTAGAVRGGRKGRGGRSSLKARKKSSSASSGGAVAGGADEEGEEEGGEDEDEEGEGGPAGGGPVGAQRRKRKPVAGLWDWHTNLSDYFKKRSGVNKLRRARPSTAHFGNWGITMAVTRLDQARDDAQLRLQPLVPEGEDEAGAPAAAAIAGDGDGDGETATATAAGAAAAAAAAAAAETVEGGGTPASGDVGALCERLSFPARVGAGFGVTSRLLFGKAGVRGSKVMHSIPMQDDDEQLIVSQWNALREVLMRPKTAIIFHLKNHYALICAMRERVVRVVPGAAGEAGSGEEACEVASGEAGKKVGAFTADAAVGEGGPAEFRVIREILTSRRGQRPKDWISWTEARETLRKWAGYKMIMVTARL